MKRIFLGWDEPALPRAASVLVDHHARDGVARMPGDIVVLPGSRAGRRLKELLVETAEGRGVRLVPPRVVTVGILPELLYEAALPVASPTLCRLTWAGVLREVPPERLQAIFARRPDRDALGEWAALGRELARLQREVSRGGHRFRDVADRCRSGAKAGRLSWNDARRWQILAEIQDEYALRLDDHGFQDPDLGRLVAIDRGRLRSDAGVWLVGISELPNVVQHALRRAAASADPRPEIRALVHAPESLADAFDDLGCVIPEAWSDAVIPLDPDRLVVRDRPDHQADEVATVLAGLEAKRAADEIVVGVPDAQIVPWIEERLTGAGVPVRYGYGEPIEDTAPYRLLEAVANYLAGRRFRDLATLTRHPDFTAWVTRQDGVEPALQHPGGWLEPLDRWYVDHLPARLPRNVRQLPGGDRRHGQVVAALMRLLDSRLLGALRARPDSRPLSGWVPPLLQLLEGVYGVRSLDRGHPGDARLVRALGVLAEAAHGLEELPDSVDQASSAASAIRLLLEESAGTVVPPEPDRAAVELLGWLELHLDDAPVTVVTGVNEPNLPESVTADAFLPDALRTHLGLVDNRARYARDAYRLTAMLHSTEELVLISGRRNATGDPLRPSRLLFAADPETVARRVQDYYDRDHEAGSGGAREPVDGFQNRADDTASDDPGGPAPENVADEAAPGAETPSTFTLPPEPTITVSEPVSSLRVTEFRALLDDPYGFALTRFRGCETLADDAREMDGLLFGQLAHAVLQDFGGDAAAVHSTDESAVASRLDELLDLRVGKRFGRDARDAHVAVRVQVEQLRARLRRFARWHADRIAQGWRVRGVECSTPEGGVSLDVDGVPMGIRARIDRVDHHPGTGAWAVFDYKTGDRGADPEKTHRTRNGAEWRDLQLPLYRWLLPRLVDEAGAPLFAGAADEEIRVGYILLPRDLGSVGHVLADWDADDLADAMEAARRVVRELRGGRFTFDPESKRTYPDDELDALLGRGQLTASGEDEA